MTSDALADVAGELYALAPADFTAARNARAKQVRAGGDRLLAAAVQSLRKPTVAAWAVNALVRHHPDDVAALVSLGAQLREAQEARAGGRLRELNTRQHELMAVARRHAEALAADTGQGLTDTVAAGVEGTLRAAMTDADAAAAVRSGVLTAELISTGFGPVEVGDAVAVAGAPALVPLPEPAVPPARAPDPDPAPAPAMAPAPAPADARAAEEQREQAARRDQQEREQAARAAREQAARRARRAEAEEDAALAQQQADEADGALRAAQDAVDELARRHAELSARIEELTAQLHEAEAQRSTAGRDRRRASTARAAAARAADAAARRARSARKRLDELA